MKKYFLTGIIILIPIVLTFLIGVFLIDLFTDPFLDVASDLLQPFEQKISWMTPDLLTFIARIVILIFLVLFIFLLGFLVRLFFFRSLLNLMNAIFSKIPLIKTVYKVTKDIVAAFFSSDKKKAFKRPVLSPFPYSKSHCIGFETGEVPHVCQEKIDTPLTAVFVPTAPHPISGYLLMVPTKDLHSIKMNNEEAVKFTVSCGIINPDVPNKDLLDYGKKS